MIDYDLLNNDDNITVNVVEGDIIVEDDQQLSHAGMTTDRDRWEEWSWLWWAEKQRSLSQVVAEWKDPLHIPWDPQGNSIQEWVFSSDKQITLTLNVGCSLSERRYRVSRRTVAWSLRISLASWTTTWRDTRSLGEVRIISFISLPPLSILTTSSKLERSRS